MSDPSQPPVPPFAPQSGHGEQPPAFGQDASTHPQHQAHSPQYYPAQQPPQYAAQQPPQYPAQYAAQQLPPQAPSPQPSAPNAAAPHAAAPAPAGQGYPTAAPQAGQTPAPQGYPTGAYAPQAGFEPASTAEPRDLGRVGMFVGLIGLGADILFSLISQVLTRSLHNTFEIYRVVDGISTFLTFAAAALALIFGLIALRRPFGSRAQAGVAVGLGIAGLVSAFYWVMFFVINALTMF